MLSLTHPLTNILKAIHLPRKSIQPDDSWKRIKISRTVIPKQYNPTSFNEFSRHIRDQLGRSDGL